jgi:hypothetical protein
MSERDEGMVRGVAWSELLPWVSIVRSFRLAIAMRVLLLGAAGILLTAIVWGLVGVTFGTDSPATKWLEPFTTCSWRAVVGVVPNEPPLADRHFPPGHWIPPTNWFHDPISGPWTLLTSPAWAGLQSPGASLTAVASVLLCGLLAAAIWAFFGAAISRIAAVQLAAGEQVGLGAALRYACRKWPAYFAAPLLPVGGMLLAAVPVALLGIVMHVVGLWLGIFLWPLVLVLGLLMALLLLGLLFGWPLMWATISAEGTDSFDALSRAYAYTFQRPLHYLFYAAVAAVIGWLGWLVVENFAAGVVWMGYWAVSWGCSSDQLDRLLNSGEGVSVRAIHFWAGCVKLLAVGYLFSYFWTATTAIYFLLRRSVDATEMDEVFLDADAGEESSALPTILADQAGAPVVGDEAEDVVEDSPKEEPLPTDEKLGKENGGEAAVPPPESP